MKKFIYLMTFAFLLMFSIVGGVYAQEVSTATELYNCLRSDTETECKLMNDIDATNFTTNTDIKGFYATNSDKTLDLNTYTLDLSTYTLYIYPDYNISIKNGQIKSDSTKYSVVVWYRGTLNLDDVSIVSDTAKVLLYAYYGSNVTINNSTLTLNSNLGKALYITGQTGYKTNVLVDSNSVITGNYAIVIDGVGSNTDASGITLDFYGKAYGVGSSESDGMALTINGLVKDTTGDVPVINVYDGAVIEAVPGTAVYGAGYGIWNFYGGEVTGDSALSIKSGVFNISGGTFKAVGEYIEEPVENTGYVTKTGSAISITYNEGYAKNVEINIKDATVISENGYALYEGNQGIDTAVTSIAISSGTFDGEQGAVSIDSVDNEVFSGFISGGTYSSKVDDVFVAESFVQKDLGEYFGIGIERKVTVNTTSNAIVSASVDNAFEGDIVTLNISIADGYVLDKLIVLDANGNSVEVVDDKFIMPDSDVTVSVSVLKEVHDNSSKEVTTNSNPQTGDNITFYIIILIISLFGLVSGILYLKRKKI